MKGSCSTTFTVTPDFKILITGACQLTHLGRARYDSGVATFTGPTSGASAFTTSGTIRF